LFVASLSNLGALGSEEAGYVVAEKGESERQSAREESEREERGEKGEERREENHCIVAVCSRKLLSSFLGLRSEERKKDRGEREEREEREKRRERRTEEKGKTKNTSRPRCWVEAREPPRSTRSAASSARPSPASKTAPCA